MKIDAFESSAAAEFIQGIKKWLKVKINYNGNHRLWFKLAVYKHEMRKSVKILRDLTHVYN